MAKVLCPVCGVNEMQSTSRRCAPCAYKAKSITSKVKTERYVERVLAGETLALKVAPWQVTMFVDVLLGIRMAVEAG
jgi:NMD protein affecting ribosome stability and mRNA decay